MIGSATLGRNGADAGASGVRGAGGDQAFYAADFRDRDGNKSCAVKVGPG